MKNNNHIVLQGWMINELNLKGNELIVYALIFGFSQDGESKFTGSTMYVANWLNASRQTAINVLKSLTEKEYIIKTDVEKNGVKFCEYTINFGTVETLQDVKKFDTTCQKILHNNIYNNIDKNNNLSKDKLLQKNSKKPSKQSYLDKCEKVLLEYDFSELVIDKIMEFLEHKKLNETQLTGQLQILARDYKTEQQQIEAINNSITYGYNGLCYPKKQYNNYKRPKDDIGLTKEQEIQMYQNRLEHEKEIAELGVEGYRKKHNMNEKF